MKVCHRRARGIRFAWWKANFAIYDTTIRLPTVVPIA